MENIIKKLADIAEKLDSKDLKNISGKIDKVSRSLLSVKTAQFVGVQGYMIRNSRCWQNCYRQGRVTNPDMAAQNVWEKCHKEYLESINNDKSGWEKYAGDDSLIKTASSSDFEKKIIKREREEFFNNLKNKIEAGESVGFAFAYAVEEGLNKYSNKMVDCSDSLLSISEEISKTGNDEISKALISVASEVVKESAFGGGAGGNWNPLNWFRSNKSQLQGRVQNLISAAREVSTAFQQWRQSPRDQQSLANYKNLMHNFQVDMQEDLNVFKRLTTGDDPNMQSVMQSYQALNSRVEEGQRINLLNNLVKSIQGWYNSMESKEQSAPPPLPAGAQTQPGEQQQAAVQGDLTPGELAVASDPTNAAGIMRLIMNDPSMSQIVLQYFTTYAKKNAPQTVAFSNRMNKKAAIGEQELSAMFQRNPKQFAQAFWKSLNSTGQIPMAAKFIQQNYADQLAAFSDPADQAGEQAVEPTVEQEPQADMLNVDSVVAFLNDIKSKLAAAQVGPEDKKAKSGVLGAITYVMKSLPNLDRFLQPKPEAVAPAAPQDRMMSGEIPAEQQTEGVVGPRASSKNKIK